MRNGRWVALAALAALAWAAPSFADDELSAMKGAMDEMKIEMEAMRSQLAAEREALRDSAGGAPEGLTSAKGNATIRIGGEVRVRYMLGWANGFRRQHYVAYDEGGRADGQWTGERSTLAGWDVAKAELDFDIDLSSDTVAFIGVRFDGRGTYDLGILDNAYWEWKNVGGSDFGLKVGLLDIPFGMWANSDFGGYDFLGVDRPLIADPFVRTAAHRFFVPIARDDMPIVWAEDDSMMNQTSFGILGTYQWGEQLAVKAAIMASSWELSQGFDSRLTYANANRNLGFVDHALAVMWNPCWLEGLHLEAAYMGRFDEGRGVDLGRPGFTADGRGPFVEGNPYANDFTQVRSGDHAYKPSFDLGVNYKVNDRWRVYGEGVVAWNPCWGDGMTFAVTTGVDWRLTDKLMLGAGFEYFHANYAAEYYFNESSDLFWGSGPLYENLYRLTLGAKYDFGNGLYLQAQYYHDIMYAAGCGDQGLKDADVILLQTGFKF